MGKRLQEKTKEKEIMNIITLIVGVVSSVAVILGLTSFAGIVGFCGRILITILIFKELS